MNPRPRLIISNVAAVLAIVALTTLGCATADKIAKSVEVTAADAQVAMADAYDAAKADNAKAGKACGDAARARNVAIVTFTPGDAESGARVQRECSAVGVTVPYNPVRLNALVGPINATKEAVLGVDSARKSLKAGAGGDVSGALAKALAAAKSFYAAARDAGWNGSIGKLDEFLKQEAAR